MTELKTGSTAYTVDTAHDALLYAIGVIRQHGRKWPPFCVEQSLLGSIEAEIQESLRKVKRK